jgi:hypothetical protein
MRAIPCPPPDLCGRSPRLRCCVCVRNCRVLRLITIGATITIAPPRRLVISTPTVRFCFCRSSLLRRSHTSAEVDQQHLLHVSSSFRNGRHPYDERAPRMGTVRRMPALKRTQTTDPHPAWAFVRAGLLLAGGTARALRTCVSVAAPCGLVDRRLLQRAGERRSRARYPSSSAKGPQAPGGQAASSPSRPAIHGRDQQNPSASSMVIAPRPPADAPSVAPGARATEVDLPAEISGGQATDSR